MLLYDNGSDKRRVIILAASDNLTITEESISWYLDGTFKSAPQLFYQLLTLHAELTDTPRKSWIFPTVYIVLSHRDIRHHPHLEQASTKGKINCYRRGDWRAATERKNRYLEKDASLKQIVSTYLREQRGSVPGSSCRVVDFCILTNDERIAV